ncbi:MAG: glycosyltransferase [Carboxylicivirga sp.]|jgi:hypothetical protein|nr:glycosyltransferase [Carboxylicivirga sp.]
MEKVFTKYFSKHQVAYEQIIESDLKLVVPVYLEEDTIAMMLKSVAESQLSTQLTVEVILVFNYAEDASQEVIGRQHRLLDWVIKNKVKWCTEGLSITILKAFNIVKKHAGVGYARKCGMDYAAYSFFKQDKPDGITISLDADTKVEENYLEAIYRAFKTNSYIGASIYFEHPLSGELEHEVYQAIAEYELHLRYYLQALRYAGFPYAYHTVGSCLAATAEAYVKAGGMPSKQAGEDFYFLQKVIPQGNFGEINKTCVYPSSRPSDRVPFGTGPSITNLLATAGEYMTYNLQAFIDLKEFISIKDQLYQLADDEVDDFVHQLSGRFRSYLVNSDFFKALKPVKDNCSSIDVFRKRFYEVFNAFRVVKYLNYTHNHFLERTPVFDAALSLFEQIDGTEPDVFESNEILELYRKLEKS